MKIIKHIGPYTFEIEGKSIKDMWKNLSDISEVFSDQVCGACKSDNIAPVHRVVDDNDFYEIRCNECYAKLSFGQHKKGDTLFPHRKDKDGKYKPNGGWEKYVKNNTEEQSAESKAQSAPPKKTGKNLSF